MDCTAVDHAAPLSIDTMHVVHPRAVGLDVRTLTAPGRWGSSWGRRGGDEGGYWGYTSTPPLVNGTFGAAPGHPGRRQVRSPETQTRRWRT